MCKDRRQSRAFGHVRRNVCRHVCRRMGLDMRSRTCMRTDVVLLWAALCLALRSGTAPHRAAPRRADPAPPPSDSIFGNFSRCAVPYSPTHLPTPLAQARPPACACTCTCMHARSWCVFFIHQCRAADTAEWLDVSQVSKLGVLRSPSPSLVVCFFSFICFQTGTLLEEIVRGPWGW